MAEIILVREPISQVSVQQITRTITVSQLRGPQGPPGSAPSVPYVDIQAFTTVGEHTWSKPAGAQLVRVLLIGTGAGGSSGQVKDYGAAAVGGGGGSGGGVTLFEMLASELDDTVSVVIGNGGVGGVGNTVDDSQASGSDGEPTSFGDIIAVGGLGPSGRSADVSAGRRMLHMLDGSLDVAYGGSCSTAAVAGSGTKALHLKPTGGGSGGGVNSINTVSAGAAGGVYSGSGNVMPSAGADAGAAGGGDGADGVDTSQGGYGGGGGGGNGSGNGGSGGAGGWPGGGGGGGGGCRFGYTAGDGGNGASGFVRVITFCSPE